MQIPVLRGIFTDTKADFRVAYPLNLKPIVKETGISTGYLRPVEGIVKTGTGPGVSRAAINWNGEHYRVMGSKLCRVEQDGTVIILGDVGDDGKQATMAYSFERLAIASNGNLYYLTDNVLQQVTDVNLGTVVDLIWIDGYFMTTDGEFLIVTNLNDPFTVDPLKYGSSEIDPDPVVALVKQRNEVYAVNRYTIEVFDNLGTANFPFGRIEGAQIQKGAYGTHCAIAYEGGVAFVGSGVGETPGVYLAGNGSATKISSREIDDLLSEYTESQLSLVVLETVSDKSHNLLWLRLPDKTLVYDLSTSQAVQAPVWYVMQSGEEQPYRAVDVIWCYDTWQVGDIETFDVGVLDDTISTHFGEVVPWEFSTMIVYGEGTGAVFHSLELVGLPGRTVFGEDAYISTSYSLDGRTWSQERPLFLGDQGDRKRRLVWRRQGNMRNYRIQRFRGDSRAYLAIARLEAQIERLMA